MGRNWSGGARQRHPCDKGNPDQRAVATAWRWLLDHHYWRRHSKPFNKSRRGMDRRAARLFVVQQDQSHLPGDRDYDDGWFSYQ